MFPTGTSHCSTFNAFCTVCLLRYTNGVGTVTFKLEEMFSCDINSFQLYFFAHCRCNDDRTLRSSLHELNKILLSYPVIRLLSEIIINMFRIIIFNNKTTSSHQVQKLRVALLVMHQAFRDNSRLC